MKVDPGSDPVTHPMRATAMADGGSRPWRPSGLIRLSAMLHVAAVLVLAGLAIWRGTGAMNLALAVVGLLVANHLILTIAGLWPRSRLLGPNLVDLHGHPLAKGRVFLTIDDGPDPIVTPRVLELLATHGVTASFFLIGRKAVAEPALVARILAEGHGVENHSWAHSHRFAFFGMPSFLRDLDRAQHALTSPDGRRPSWFRAPAGLRNPLLEPILCRTGLHLAAWTRRGFDTREADADTVLRRLAGDDDAGRLAAGDILLLHDGNPARDDNGIPVILRVLPRLVDTCRRQGLEVSALPDARRVHPRYRLDA